MDHGRSADASWTDELSKLDNALLAVDDVIRDLRNIQHTPVEKAHASLSTAAEQVARIRQSVLGLAATTGVPVDKCMWSSREEFLQRSEELCAVSAGMRLGTWLSTLGACLARAVIKHRSRSEMKKLNELREAASSELDRAAAVVPPTQIPGLRSTEMSREDWLTWAFSHAGEDLEALQASLRPQMPSLAELLATCDLQDIHFADSPPDCPDVPARPDHGDAETQARHGQTSTPDSGRGDSHPVASLPPGLENTLPTGLPYTGQPVAATPASTPPPSPIDPLVLVTVLPAMRAESVNSGPPDRGDLAAECIETPAACSLEVSEDDSDRAPSVQVTNQCCLDAPRHDDTNAALETGLSTPAPGRSKSDPTVTGRPAEQSRAVPSRATAHHYGSLGKSAAQIAQRAIESGTNEIAREQATGDLVWRLLYERQPAFGYWISHFATHDLDSVKVSLPDWAVRAVLLSSELRSDLGPAAAVLQLCFSEANGVAALAQATRLLLASSTLRPALLAPGTHAQDVLRELVSGLPPKLCLYAKEVLEFCKHGRALDPQLLRTRRDREAWQEETATVREKASKWFEEAQHFTIAFAPAGVAWRRWLKSDSDLGMLVSAIARNEVNRRLELEECIRRWNDRGYVERRLQEHRKREKIEGNAVTAVFRHAQDACQHVGRWLQQLARCPEEVQDYCKRPVETLRSKLKHLEREVLSELVSIRDNADDFCLGTAVDLLCDTIQGMSKMLNHDADWSRDERPVDLLTAAPLLVGGLRLDDQFRPNERPDVCRLALLSSIAKSWTLATAFARRLEVGDHVGAAQILNVLAFTPSTDMDIDEGRRNHEMGIEKCREALDRRIKSARLELDEVVKLGLLSERDHVEFSSQLDRTEMARLSSVDFPEISQLLDAQIQQISRLRSEKLATAEQELGSLRETVSPEGIARVQSLLDKGDVITAHDYLERLRRNEPLPDPRTHASSFHEFFMAGRPLCATIYEALQKKESEVQQQVQVRAADFFGSDLRSLSESQWQQAHNALIMWRKEDHTIRLVTKVLEFLGFVNPRGVCPRQPGAAPDIEVTTDPIDDPGKCPVAAFGSEAGGKYRVVVLGSAPNIQHLLDRVGNRLHGNTLVFYRGRLSMNERRELAHHCHKGQRRFLVLDTVLFTYLIREAGSRLLPFFQCSLPFSWLEPYTTTAGRVPPELFAGRQRELTALLDPRGSCLVYGGRQLGKTAVLRHVERSFHSLGDGHVARYCDLKAHGIATTHAISHLWVRIAELLKADQIIPSQVAVTSSDESLFGHVKKWLDGDPRRRILFLLDESDDFLESDGKSSPQPFAICARLKKWMEDTDRRFKVVFAGLHDVQRATRLPNQPIAHLGDPLCIGPLLSNGEARAAHELVERPLAAVGYFFGNADLVARILALTNYYPSLIQLFCMHLLRHLQEHREGLFQPRACPPFQITEEHVKDAYARLDLRRAIRERFLWTLDLDRRYRAAALVLAFEGSSSGGLEVNALWEQVSGWWPQGFAARESRENFRVLLDEMVGLGVLRHVQGRDAYALRSPNVVNLLGTPGEIEHELDGCVRWEAPLQYEPAAFRRPLTSTAQRSPLTFQQEGDLRGTRNTAAVICGCRSAGLDDLPSAVKLLFDQYYRRAEIRDRDEFDAQLRKLLESEHAGPAALFVHKEVPWNEEWVAAAAASLEKLTRTNRYVNVIFVADPARAWDLAPHVPRLRAIGTHFLSLHPWSDAALRQWLEDSNFGPRDPEGRRLLTNVTGNWPHLVSTLYRLAGGPKSLDWKKSLGDLERETHASRSTFLLEFGLDISAAVSVLRCLASFGEPLTPDQCADLTEIPLETVNHVFAWAELLSLTMLASGTAMRVDSVVAHLLS